MQVKLCQIMAGPLGVTAKGTTIECPREVGLDMIHRGLAIAVEPSPLASVVDAVGAGAQAVAQAVRAAPAQLAAPFRRKEHGGRR